MSDKKKVIASHFDILCYMQEIHNSKSNVHDMATFLFYNCFHNDIISCSLSIKGNVKALFSGEDGFSEPRRG